jgi:oligopeptide/dipeptide ABC transporter ATP-binding protein
VTTDLISAERLTMTYASRGLGTENKTALADVSLRVHAGETLGVVGESGSGKTTLGRILVRLLEPTAGTVYFDGRDITALRGRALRSVRRDLQMIFQDPGSALNPHMRIGELVGEPLDIHGVGTKSERSAAVDELLDDVGLSAAIRRRHPHEVSGGQQQRVGIARALALRPRFLVADEPVSALDVSIQAQVINLLLGLKEQRGLTYLFISHNLAVTSYISDRIVVMYAGEIVEEGPAEQLVRHPLHPYTGLLLAASTYTGSDDPPPGPAAEAPIAAQHSSCVFAARCRFRRDRCLTEKPERRTLAPDHVVACHFAEQIQVSNTPHETEPLFSLPTELSRPTG